MRHFTGGFLITLHSCAGGTPEAATPLKRPADGFEMTFLFKIFPKNSEEINILRSP
jgi:hypothetical protein